MLTTNVKQRKSQQVNTSTYSPLVKRSPFKKREHKLKGKNNYFLVDRRELSVL